MIRVYHYLGGIFDWDQALLQLDKLNQKAEDPNLWDDQKAAQQVLKDRDALSQKIDTIKKVEQDLDDALTLYEMGEEESDPDTIDESEKALDNLSKHVSKLQIASLLSGEVDANDCFIEINAGAGGTEAQDWANMLARMYARWCDDKKYKINIIDENPGEEAGIKSITMEIKGHQAYGWLKTESGVHRLVRISPFDSNSKRHTSFASVWVYPVLDDDIEIEVEDKDLRIDTYRASGAGGQHVNKTDSAVRITHLPTNIVVQCQNDRSQHRNRAQAMAMLKSRLYEWEMQKREAEAQSQNDQKGHNGWGNQIRSYVLHPYQMVKDLRTGVEKGNAQGVLDGDLDDYIEAALSQKI